MSRAGEDNHASLRELDGRGGDAFSALVSMNFPPSSGQRPRSLCNSGEMSFKIMAGAILATTRLKERTTQLWRGGTQKDFFRGYASTSRVPSSERVRPFQRGGTSRQACRHGHP